MRGKLLEIAKTIYVDIISRDISLSVCLSLPSHCWEWLITTANWAYLNMKSDKQLVISGNVEENMRKKASWSFAAIAPQLTINLARTLMNSGISSFPGKICRVQAVEIDRAV